MPRPAPSAPKCACLRPAIASGCTLRSTGSPGCSSSAASSIRRKLAASARPYWIDASPAVWSTTRTNGAAIGGGSSRAWLYLDTRCARHAAASACARASCAASCTPHLLLEPRRRARVVVDAEIVDRDRQTRLGVARRHRAQEAVLERDVRQPVAPRRGARLQRAALEAPADHARASEAAARQAERRSGGRGSAAGP